MTCVCAGRLGVVEFMDVLHVFGCRHKGPVACRENRCFEPCYMIGGLTELNKNLQSINRSTGPFATQARDPNP